MMKGRFRGGEKRRRGGARLLGRITQERERERERTGRVRLCAIGWAPESLAAEARHAAEREGEEGARLSGAEAQHRAQQAAAPRGLLPPFPPTLLPYVVHTPHRLQTPPHTPTHPHSHPPHHSCPPAQLLHAQVRQQRGLRSRRAADWGVADGAARAAGGAPPPLPNSELRSGGWRCCFPAAGPARWDVFVCADVHCWWQSPSTAQAVPPTSSRYGRVAGGPDAVPRAQTHPDCCGCHEAAGGGEAPHNLLRKAAGQRHGGGGLEGWLWWAGAGNRCWAGGGRDHKHAASPDAARC